MPSLILRLVCLAYLWKHYTLLLPDVLSPWFSWLLFILAAGVSALSGTAARRLCSERPSLFPALDCLAPAAGPALFFLLSTAVSAVCRLPSALNPAIDGLPAFLDSHLLLLSPALAAVMAIRYMDGRLPCFAAYEPAVHGLLLALVFWRFSSYHTGIYAHPAWAALSVGAFVVVALMAVSVREGRITGALILAPPLLGLMYALFSLYADGATVARGGLLKPELFKFDFSDYVRLEDEIRLSRDLVLLFRRTGRPEQYLLRRAVLSGYRPGGIFYHDPNEPALPRLSSVPRGPLAVEPLEAAGREDVTQEVYLVSLEPNTLIALNDPFRVEPLAAWTGSSFSRVYRVESRVNVLYPFELSDVPDSGLLPAHLEYYTRHDQDPRLAELARSITAGLETYYERVQAIHDFLAYEYYYSLTPGIAADGNQLAHFLFESRKGYCSYFAFAMTLLCRHLGIPARVAIGFYIDPTEETLGFYPVRADMAHAWVEVHFAGHGWIEFDPTSRIPAEGEPLPAEDDGGRSSFIGLLEEIIENLPRARPEIAENRPAADGRGLPAALGLWPLFLILAACGAYFYVRWRDALRLAPWVDARRRTLARWSLLVRAIAPPRSPGRLRSAAELVEQLRAEQAIDAGVLFELRQRALFAPRYSPEEDGRARAEAARLRARLYRAAPVLARLRSWLHPRSLRAGLLVLCACLCLSRSISAQDGPPWPREVEAILTEVSEYVADHNHEAAFRLLSSARARHPGERSLMIALGDLYFDKKLFRQAMSEYRAAEQADDPEILRRLARTLARLNEHEAAIGYHERVVRLAPEDRAAVSDLAWMYFKTHRLERGERLLLETSARIGMHRTFAMLLGTIYAAMYDQENARRSYLRAIEDARGDDNFLSVAYYNLALLEKGFFEYERALAATEASLVAVDRAGGHLVRGDLFQARLDFPIARREFGLARARDTTPLSLLSLAGLYRRFGRLPEALAHASAAAERRDHSWMYYFGIDPERYLMDLHETLRDIARARERAAAFTAVAGPVAALARIARGLEQRALAVYHDVLHRTYARRAAAAYLRGGSRVNGYYTYSLAFSAYPSIAGKYLRAARRLEVELSPQSERFYDLLEGKLFSDVVLLRAALDRFVDPWEREYMAEALSGLARAYERGGDHASRDRAVVELYGLNPAAPREAGLRLPLSLRMDGGPAARARMAAALYGAGFRVDASDIPAPLLVVSEAGGIIFHPRPGETGRRLAAALLSGEPRPHELADLANAVAAEVFSTR